jgi:hypothetical protein
MSQPIEAGRQHLYEKTAHATGSIIMNIAVRVSRRLKIMIVIGLIVRYSDLIRYQILLAAAVLKLLSTTTRTPLIELPTA